MKDRLVRLLQDNSYLDVLDDEHWLLAAEQLIANGVLLSDADVVEVVRCKDCVNRNTPDCAMWYQCSICGGQWSWNVENGFCWCGERR